MNPCTCRDPRGLPFAEYLQAYMSCPLHGVERPPFAEGPREPQEPRKPAPKFEGMGREDLDSLKSTPVGTFDRFGGHLMLRWEESSPLTRIIADGRPEGSVDLSEAWMLRADVGSAQSALRAAMKRWPGREWSREDGPRMFGIRLSWRPARAHAYAEGEEKPLLNAPDLRTRLVYGAMVKEPGAIVKITAP